MSSSPARRRTLDFVKPEQSLAEWSSKIRELQEQVDRDEALEQQLLEDEIARSRLERARRRNTAGSTLASASYRMNRNRLPEDLQQIVDQQQHHSDALRKLTGETPARTSTPLSGPPATEGSPAQSLHPPQPSQSIATSKPAVPGPSAATQPMSLAEFMGGTSSGPRLNKHTPQADPTDPTLFVPQRSMKDLPGSGNSTGFALPGLATQTRQAQSSSQASSPTPVQAPWVSPSARSASPFASSNTPQPASKSSTPDPHRSLSRSGNNYTHNSTVPVSVGGRSVSPHNALVTKPEQERVSTPVQDPSSVSTPTGSSPAPKFGITSRWPPAATLDATPPKVASPRPLSASPSLSASTSTSTSHNLTSSPTLSSSTGPQARSPPPTSLARPVQPSPVVPQTFLPPTSKPSPAFRKPAPLKEERPSITRLKGRGFVEKRVQASAYLTDLAKGTEPSGRRSSSSGPPEKKLSVLERWPEVREGSDTPNKPGIKDLPSSKSPSKSQWPPVSTPSTAPRLSPSLSPGFRTTRSASPSTPEVKKERNPERDATPLRLPGMASVRPLPVKAQSQPTPKSNATDHFAPATPGGAASPVRLPGMATTALSGVIEGSSLPNSLRMSGRRRSVHFEDDAEVLKSKAEYDTDRDDWRGTMTDPGGSSRLTHLTKERTRKPKKSGSAGRAAVPTASTPLKEVYKAPEPEGPKPDRTIASVPQQTTKVHSTPAPVTPIPSTAPAPKPKPSPPTERPEVNTVKGPPIIQPKPAAYRRSSHSSGDESSHIKQALPGLVSTTPLSQSPRPVLSHAPSSNLRTDSSVEPAQRESPGPTEQPREQSEDEHPKVNIKAAIAAWGQKSSVPPSPGPSLSFDVEKEPPKSAVIGLGEREDEEPPKVDVKGVIASWGRASPSPSSTPAHMQIQIGRPAPAPPSPAPPSPSPFVSQPSASQSPVPQARPRPVNPNNNVERRRSKTFDRYSAIMMPPLKEEKTPMATPEGSMKVATPGVPPSVQAIHDSLLKANQGKHGDRPNSGSEDTAVDEVEITAETTEGQVKGSSKRLFLEVEEGVPVREQVTTSAPVSPMDEIVRLEHDDGPIGSFNLTALLASRPAAPKANQRTISVESFAISGSTSTHIDSEPHIFYDGDVVAIVHRAKGKASDLVTMTLWGWEGRHSQCNENEKQKLNELASRFGTKLINVPQGKEPFEMAQVLGGTVVIRHGSRAHWTAENTALYCVRMHGHHYVIIEEVELESVNLCSAFSYCLAVLDALYIWHGKGSTMVERQAAVDCAQYLLKGREGVEPTVLEEGSEDEMFWLMLGEGGYASADYWRFRPQSMVISPRLWSVQPQGGLTAIQPFCAYDLKPDGVYLFDGVFELFVIVGVMARGRRSQIRLAVAAAEATSAASAVTRIFSPPVHILIFPTRVPIDLRANFRLFDEYKVNGQEVPDHINLLTLGEGQEQLAKLEWTRRELRDSDFLPLGIDPSKVP